MYHGGKWKIAPWIIGHLPEHHTYVEPYGGAASVLLRKPRSRDETYNDLDGEIVNLFKIIRDHPRRMTRALLWTPYSRAEYRAAFDLTDDPFEMARRTIIRSFMGFAGVAINREKYSGFRARSNRFGGIIAREWMNYPKNVRTLAARFRGVTLENKPAIDIIHQQDGPETLFYLDPPYVHDTREITGKGVYAHEMSDDDHRELAAVITTINGMAVLSGYRGGLYDELYGGWHSVERNTRAGSKRPRVEVLWLNEAAASKLQLRQSRQLQF